MLRLKKFAAKLLFNKYFGSIIKFANGNLLDVYGIKINLSGISPHIASMFYFQKI
jgi:hypothetical protein